MSALLSVRVDDVMNDQLEACASLQHTTRTEVVKNALTFYFKSTQSKLKEQMSILRKIDNDNDYLGDDTW